MNEGIARVKIWLDKFFLSQIELNSNKKKKTVFFVHQYQLLIYKEIK